MFQDFSFVKKSGDFFDVNFNPYQAKFNENAIPSAWILYQSFKSENASLFFENKTKLLQESMGINRTVWAYKLNKSGLASWEYYYYYHKVFNNHSCENVLYNLGKFNLIKELPELSRINSEYYILSFDFIEEKAEFITIYYPDILQPFSDNFKVYLPQGQHYFDIRTKGFISYNIVKDKLVPTNYYKGFYPFPYEFNAETTYAAIQSLCQTKIPDLAHCPCLSDIFNLPFLIEKTPNSQPFAIAIKKESIKLYFLKLPFSTFITFIKHFKYPISFIECIVNEYQKLNHLKYDFAFEVSYNSGDGFLKIDNPVIYGTF